MNITYLLKSIGILFSCFFLLACNVPSKEEKIKMVDAILQNAKQGDMIIAHSERLTAGVILLVERNDTASKKITGIELFGFGEGKTMPYSDIIAILLEEGDSVSIIPKRNVRTTIRSITEIATDFSH